MRVRCLLACPPQQPRVFRSILGAREYILQQLGVQFVCVPPGPAADRTRTVSALRCVACDWLLALVIGDPSS